MKSAISVLLIALAFALTLRATLHAQVVRGTPYCISESFNETAGIISLVNYLYGRGPAPEPVAFAGNIDCQGGVNLVDVVYLVNYVYRGGPYPCDFCGWYRDPSDTEDAATIAMFLGAEVFAPPPLMERVQNDLERIRGRQGVDQTPISSLHFVTPWIAGRVKLSVDGITFAAIQQGEYHAWDSLNSHYGLSSYDLVSFCYPDCNFYVNLRFEGIINCPALATIYRTLPGVLAAHEELAASFGGDDPNGIFPKQRGDTITYLFFADWGGCLDVCWNRWYRYACALPDTAWIIGDWLLIGEFPWDNRDAPEWWPEAEENIWNYIDFGRETSARRDPTRIQR